MLWKRSKSTRAASADSGEAVFSVPGNTPPYPVYSPDWHGPDLSSPQPARTIG